MSPDQDVENAPQASSIQRRLRELRKENHVIIISDQEPRGRGRTNMSLRMAALWDEMEEEDD